MGWCRVFGVVVAVLVVAGCSHPGEEETLRLVEVGEPLLTEALADIPGIEIESSRRLAASSSDPDGDACGRLGCDNQYWTAVIRATVSTDTKQQAQAITEQIETAIEQGGYVYQCTNPNTGLTIWAHPDLPGSAAVGGSSLENRARLGHSMLIVEAECGSE